MFVYITCIQIYTYNMQNIDSRYYHNHGYSINLHPYCWDVPHPHPDPLRSRLFHSAFHRKDHDLRCWKQMKRKHVDTNTVISHRIHVWYIHLHWLIFMVNVGENTIHGSYGYRMGLILGVLAYS